jgi:hypothetical protein
MTIAGFYQCWKHSAATIQVVKEFRRFYPDSTVYLISDGSHDYGALAKEYNCLYEHGHEATNMFFNDISLMRIFFERFRRAMNVIDEEWCMIMEDDIKILDIYDESIFKKEMHGYKEGNFIPSLLQKYIQLFYPSQTGQLVFSGFGGTIINVPFFRKIFNDNPIRHLEFIWTETVNFTNSELSWGKHLTRNFDIIMSTLCYVYGGSIGLLEQVRQITENNPKAVVVHNYKDLYNLEPESEDKHLVILKY